MTVNLLAAADEVRRRVEDPRFDEITEAAASNTVCLSVKHPERFRKGDLVYVTRSGENFVVEAVKPDGTLNVSRGLDTAPCPLKAGDEVLVAGRLR